MSLKSIYTYGGFPAKRNLTVADIIALKGVRKMTMVDATTREEAEAAEAAGIDVLSIWDAAIMEVRAGAPNTFIVGALAMTDYETPDDILRAAVRVMNAGADMVYTPRGFKVVQMLADEGMSVMGHVGLIPRRSTQVGGLRAIGKTADEAMHVLDECRRYEEAGACWVEVECMASEALAEISKHTSLITHSIGAGIAADMMYLFMEDICGDNPDLPRHARAFGDLLSIRKQLNDERKRALGCFKAAVESGSFPDAATSISMPSDELEKLREALDKRQPLHH